MSKKPAYLIAGIPTTNATLYWKTRFLVGDPTAYLSFPKEDGGEETLLILRDIEIERAKQFARADTFASPSGFFLPHELSSNRETATAQAVAEVLRLKDFEQVVADRSLPLVYFELLRAAGIEVFCDYEGAILGRRQKDEQEIEWIRQSQYTTELAMKIACETIANATALADGTLTFQGAVLTSERIKIILNMFLLDQGYGLVPWIVAGGPQGGDCHEHGSGPLRTGEPIIIDVFPQGPNRYWGDCTRTVVHGDIPDEVLMMHAAVAGAKQAATRKIKAGISGHEVHQATVEEIQTQGYGIGLPDPDQPDTYTALTHGTGHGIGLEVHEQPLLDFNGPILLPGDVVSVEPGLYCKAIGGVRIEDLVVVYENGAENLNSLYEGLVWK